MRAADAITELARIAVALRNLCARFDFRQGGCCSGRASLGHQPGGRAVAKPFPLNPKHPERICWGCDRYCATDALACGNGSDRTQHPVEYQGEDWYLAWGIEPEPDRPGQAKKQR
ncbi:MAG: DUF3079 domain-containing protein [Stenotrophomonas sp.]